jgi:dolichol-phosphate mannosyltransferase
MLQRWEEGTLVVQAIRETTSDAGLLKRWSSRGFYWLFSKLAHCELKAGASDFRLLDRVVLDALLQLEERERFLRGMIGWLGFDVAEIRYHASARVAGQTHYSFGKMMALALSGLISFSLAPLRLAALLGLVCVMLSLLYLAYAVTIWAMGLGVPGWASLIAVTIFMGGIQLIVIGIQSEYLGRVYLEAKRRPIYVVRRRLGFGPREEQSDQTPQKREAER